MLIFNEVSSIRVKLDELVKNGKTIGFVPTMGALHAGHISLVHKAASENDIVVVSIFVNPTQFNNPEDLKNYPKTPENDHKMLEENKVNILFSPEVNEIYHGKENDRDNIPLGQLEDVMEGEHRPGHFAGVVQIVSRLFEIVKPQKAYFGEKDFQQLTVIRYMTDLLRFPVEIIGCPTVREKSGLAMSSRNLRLTEEGLMEAAEISKALKYAQRHWQTNQPRALKEEVIDRIEATGELTVEYIEFADEATLEKVLHWKNHKHVRCFAAVFCEEVRLIDNIRIF